MEPLVSTRKAGLACLEAFAPFAGEFYARRRNFDLGPEERGNVSGLSPWIRHRLLLEPEVVGRVVDLHGPDRAETFVREVVWRSYFKGYLEQRPGLWERYTQDLGDLIHQMRLDPELGARVGDAASGRTGIECFDAWTHELLTTGYLHNHARMWFASIWTHTLGLPWQLGADLFLRHLLDGDPASNLLGWRWVVGLHTPGKTYLARPDNIVEFTAHRFDRPMNLAQSAEALTEDPIEPSPIIASDTIAAGREYVLLVTEEDCDPISLDLPHPPVAVVGCDLDAGWSPLGRAAAPALFARGAVDDALRRAGEEWGVQTMHFSDPEAFVQWAHAQGWQTLATAWIATGPIAEAFAVVQDELGDSGIEVLKLRRHWDEAAWPEATRGFFRMKRVIPDLLEQVV